MGEQVVAATPTSCPEIVQRDAVLRYCDAKIPCTISDLWSCTTISSAYVTTTKNNKRSQSVNIAPAITDIKAA